MFLIILLAVLMVFKQLQAWVHNKPSSEFRARVFGGYRQALSIAFWLWMCVMAPMVASRFTSLGLAEKVQAALAESVFSSSSPIQE